MSRVYLYLVAVAALVLVLSLPLVSAAADEPPAPTLTSNPPNVSPSSSATFAFSDTDLTVTFQCQIDGAVFALCASPVTYSGLGDGAHTFGVKAVDPLLNESTVTSHSWTVDTTPPPAPTIGSKPANPTNATAASLSFSDSEAGVGFQCRLDGNAFSACTSPASYSGLSAASHTFTVRAVDAAGNQSATSYTWVIDTTPPPAPTIGSKPANPTNATAASLSFSDSEASVGFQCRLDGNAFSACTSPASYSGLSAASHTFTVRAVDAAGNQSATSYTWVIDTTPPPAPTIGSKPANPTNATAASLSFSDSEAGVGFQCRLDGNAFSACTSPASYSGLSAASHTFTVRAVDAAGNQSATSYTWVIDTTPPPAPTIGSKPANPTNATAASLSFSDSEAGVGFQCRLDGNAFSACTSPASYSGLSAASHTFTVRAVDAAGNRSATSYTWVIDTTSPAITLTEKPTDPSADPDPHFSFSANEAVKGYECKLNGASFVPCTSPVMYGPLSSAQFTFTVQATDLAGNTGSTNYTWTLDLDAPVASINSGPASSTNQTSAAFAFSSNKSGSSFQCQLDGGSFASCTSPKSYPSLANGVHTFVVKASDALHNGPPSPPYRWSVDTVAPETTITMTPDPVNANASSTFGFTSSEAGSSFACSLDGGTFTACSSPRTYDGLTDGPHTFRVRAADSAGNVDPTPASFAWQVATLAPPDLTSPGNVRGVKRTVGYGLLEMAWGLPPDADFDHVRVLVSTSRKKAARRIVYTGKARHYVDRRFKNGTYYRYSIVSYDHAGNASHGVTVVVAASALLRSPREGSVVHSPPFFRWGAIKKASFYNVQLYYGGRKVLSRWPRAARLRLGRTWTYEGQNFRLKKGTYHWYVWPGFGPRLKSRYGQLLGQSTFRVG